MRWFRVAVGLGALGLVAQVANAEKVPSFVRQTGLTCNQCHMTWTPTPDMTFTGTKFRLNGYRTPWVAEKIEAGEEGALNGRRLVLGIDGYLSYHMRSSLATQSKPASDPALVEPKANSIATRPFGSLAWDFTGPITEHVGIWTEWYSTSGNGLETQATANQYGIVDNDEFDVKMVFNPGDGGNIIGFGINNQSRTSPFFGAFGSGVASSQGNTVNVSAYTWLRDRAALAISLIPGQNEQDVGGWDYKRMSYGFTGAVLPMNTDAMWLMFTGAFMVGNDMNPIGNVTGVNALRTGAKAGVNYSSYDLGDAKRLLLDMRWGSLDRGHWSWNTATGFSTESETYSDGAEVKNTAVSSTARLFYDRTYGIILSAGKRLTYSYTEANGTVHDIPSDVSLGATFIYRMAMNFAWELAINPTAQTLRLDQNWRNGWSYNFSWHFLY